MSARMTRGEAFYMPKLVPALIELEVCGLAASCARFMWSIEELYFVLF